MVYTIFTENKINKKISNVWYSKLTRPQNGTYLFWHYLRQFDKKKKNKCGRQTWQKTVHARHQNLLRNKKTNEVKT